MKKYNINLTEAEMRMIRTALELEADRRAEFGNDRAKDFENLAERFQDVLMEIRKNNI
jgi:hypothetical protein